MISAQDVETSVTTNSQTRSVSGRSNSSLVSFAAVFWHVMQRFHQRRALRDMPKDGFEENSFHLIKNQIRNEIIKTCQISKSKTLAIRFQAKAEKMFPLCFVFHH